MIRNFSHALAPRKPLQINSSKLSHQKLTVEVEKNCPLDREDLRYDLQVRTISVIHANDSYFLESYYYDKIEVCNQVSRDVIKQFIELGGRGAGMLLPPQKHQKYMAMRKSNFMDHCFFLRVYNRRFSELFSNPNLSSLTASKKEKIVCDSLRKDLEETPKGEPLTRLVLNKTAEYKMNGKSWKERLIRSITMIAFVHLYNNFPLVKKFFLEGSFKIHSLALRVLQRARNGI